MGSGGKSGGEDVESVVVDVEYAMERKEMDLLLRFEEGYMNIETFSYVLQSNAATRAFLSATNPLPGADLLDRSARRRTVRCRLERQKLGPTFCFTFLFGEWIGRYIHSDRRERAYNQNELLCCDVSKQEICCHG